MTCFGGNCIITDQLHEMLLDDSFRFVSILMYLDQSILARIVYEA